MRHVLFLLVLGTFIIFFPGNNNFAEEEKKSDVPYMFDEERIREFLKDKPIGLYVRARFTAFFNANPIIKGAKDAKLVGYLNDSIGSNKTPEDPPICYFPKGAKRIPDVSDYQEAIALYDQIITKFPEEKFTTECSFSGGRQSGLVPAPDSGQLRHDELFENHLGKYPDLAADLATLEKAVCLQKLGRQEEAYKILSTLVEKYKKGHYEKEDYKFRKKIDTVYAFLRPEECALFLLAQADKNQERFAQAIKRFQEIIKRYPTCELTYMSFDEMASIYESQKEYEKAIRTLKEKWRHIEKEWPVYLGGKGDEDPQKVGIYLLYSNERARPIYSKKKLRLEIYKKIENLEKRAGNNLNK